MEGCIGNSSSYSYFPVSWSFWYISHSSDMQEVTDVRLGHHYVLKVYGVGLNKRKMSWV